MNNKLKNETRLKPIASSWFKKLILKSDISNMPEIFENIAKPYFNEGLFQYLQGHTTLALEMFEEANHVLWMKGEKSSRYGQLTGYLLGNCYYLIRKKGELCHNLIMSIHFYDCHCLYLRTLSSGAYSLSKISLMNSYFELINIINQLTYDDKEGINILANNNSYPNPYDMDFPLLNSLGYYLCSSIEEFIEGLLNKVNSIIKFEKHLYDKGESFEHIFLLNQGKYYYHLSYLKEENILLSNAIECFKKAKLILPKTNSSQEESEINILLIKTLSRIANLESNVKYLIEAETMLENFIKTINSKRQPLLATLYYYRGMIDNQILKFESNNKQNCMNTNGDFEKTLNLFKDIQNKSLLSPEGNASLMLNIGLTYIAIANQQNTLKNSDSSNSLQMAIDAIKSAKSSYEKINFRHDSKKAEKLLLLLHSNTIPDFPNSFLDIAKINIDEKKELDLFLNEMIDKKIELDFFLDEKPVDKNVLDYFLNDRRDKKKY